MMRVGLLVGRLDMPRPHPVKSVELSCDQDTSNSPVLVEGRDLGVPVPIVRHDPSVLDGPLLRASLTVRQRRTAVSRRNPQGVGSPELGRSPARSG